MDDERIDLDILLPRAVLARIVDAIAALQAGDRDGCERLIDEALFLQAYYAETDEVAYQA